MLGRAGEEGQRKRLEAAKKGEVTWFPPPGLGRPYDEDAEKKQAAAQAEKKRAARQAERDEQRKGIELEESGRYGELDL